MRARKSHTFGKMPRGRRIVVDLLTMIAPTAVPCFLIRDIDVTWANVLKDRLKAEGSKITVTAILLKAIAVAQKNHPASRTELVPFGRTVTYEDIVAGFTVERMMRDEDTVFFGEIESPHEKSISRIAEELTQYVEDKPSSIAPLALQNIYSGLPYFLRRTILFIGQCVPAMRLKCQKATFGLTTLGKYGISSVLSPCICTSTFGIGTIEDRTVVINNRVEIRPRMTITYNYNAKVIDGQAAANFFKDVCDLMEGGLAEQITAEERQLSTKISRRHLQTAVR